MCLGVLGGGNEAMGAVCDPDGIGACAEEHGHHEGVCDAHSCVEAWWGDGQGGRANPWALIERFPADLDLVAVVDNPAEKLMSQSAQQSRAFLASIGMFSKTRSAWTSIGELFGSDVDDAITTLMSGRVALIADGIFEHRSEPFAFATSVDRNWVLVAEIDSGKMDRLRKALKPVPRVLWSGVPIYGIEQGRYALVMLDDEEAEGRSRVMISPKGGKSLLQRVLGAVEEGEAGSDGCAHRVCSSDLPEWGEGSAWSLAIRVDVAALIDGFSEEGADEEGGVVEREFFEGHPIRAMIGQSEVGVDGTSGLEVRLSMNAGRSFDVGAPPMALYESLPDDTVMAVAMGSLLTFEFDQWEGLAIEFRDEGECVHSVGDQTLIPDGTLLVFDRDDARSILKEKWFGMTAITRFRSGAVHDHQHSGHQQSGHHDGREGGLVLDAARVDGLIEPMIFSSWEMYSEDGRPGFGGAFPDAIRTQTITSWEDDSELGDGDGLPLMSWKTGVRSGSTDLLFSFGKSSTPTADRVGAIDSIADTLDALSNGQMYPLAAEAGSSGMVTGQGSRSLMHGMLRLDEVMAELGVSSMLWETMAGAGASGDSRVGFGPITTVRWEVVEDHQVLRARVSLTAGE